MLANCDAHGHVDEGSEQSAVLVAAGRTDEVIRTLGHGLLREDAGFHEFRILDAAVMQARRPDRRRARPGWGRPGS